MIRDYSAADFNKIIEINNRSFDDPEPKSFILKGIEEGRAWVAVDKDEVIGFLIGKTKHEVPYINNIAVLKEHRGNGIAKELINKFEEFFGTFQKPENKHFWLQVRSDSPAQKLYFDLGYRTIWVDTNYYGRGQHALNMHKSIKPIWDII